MPFATSYSWTSNSNWTHWAIHKIVYMDFKGEGSVENIGYNGLREGDKKEDGVK